MQDLDCMGTIMPLGVNANQLLVLARVICGKSGVEIKAGELRGHGLNLLFDFATRKIQDLLVIHCASLWLRLKILADYSNGHYVEYGAWISIFRIPEFLIKLALGIGTLNVSIYLVLNSYLPGMYDHPDALSPWLGFPGLWFFFGYLFDVQRFLVCDVKAVSNFIDHILH